MKRITPTDLRKTVDKINEYLKTDGIPLRFEREGRNNYQAVDEYKVHADGSRDGSGCNRNIGCGTSREVIAYCWEAYGHLSRAAKVA